MPIREFVCTNCANSFERIFKTQAADEQAKGNAGDACPQCGAIADRVISRPAQAQFKGSGFYKNDYPK